MSIFGCCGSKRHVRTIEKRSAKSVLATLHSAIVSVNLSNGGTEHTGILLSSSLILTTHNIVPSRASAENGHITLCHTAAGQQGTGVSTTTGTKKKLLPQRFFLTNRAMDVTILACEDAAADGVSTLDLDLNQAGCDEAGDLLDMGDLVYILGHTEEPCDHVAVTMGESVICGEEFETSVVFWSDTKKGYEIWTPGSAGFDTKGDFKFLVNRPIEIEGSEAIMKKVDKTEQSGTKIRAITEWLLAHGVKNLNDLPTGLPPARITKPALSFSPVEKPNIFINHGPIDCSPSRSALILSKQDLHTPPPGSAESSTKTIPRFEEDLYRVYPFSLSQEEEVAGRSTKEDGATPDVCLQSEPGTNNTESAISFGASSKLMAEELLEGEIVGDNTVQLQKMQVAASSTKETLTEELGETSLTPPSTPPVSRREVRAAMIIDITNTIRDSGNTTLNSSFIKSRGQATKSTSPRGIPFTAAKNDNSAANTEELSTTTNCVSPIQNDAAVSVQESVQGRTAGDSPASQPFSSRKEGTVTTISPPLSTNEATKKSSNLQPVKVTLSRRSSEEGSTTWYSATYTPHTSPMKPGATMSAEGDSGACIHPQSPTTPSSALHPLGLKMRIQQYGNTSRSPKSITPFCSPGLIGTLPTANIPVSEIGVPSPAHLSPRHSPLPKGSNSPANFSPSQFPVPPPLLSQPQSVPETDILVAIGDQGGQSLVATPKDAGKSASTCTTRSKTEGYENVSRIMLPAQAQGSRGLSLATPVNFVVAEGKDIHDVVSDIGAAAVSGGALLGLAPKKPEVDEHSVPLELIRSMGERTKDQ